MKQTPETWCPTLLYMVHNGHVNGCAKKKNAEQQSSQTCRAARSIFCCWPTISSRSFSTASCLPFMCSRCMCVSCSRHSKVLRMSWDRQQVVVNRKYGGKFITYFVCSMQFFQLDTAEAQQTGSLSALLVAPTWMSCCSSWICFLLFLSVSSAVLSCSSSFTFCLYSGPEAMQLELHHQH